MKTLLAWIQLIPALIDIVVYVEKMIPLPSVGDQKLALLVALLRTLYETTENVRKEFPWDKLVETVTKAVKVIVDAFNGLGLFKKDQGAPAPNSP